MTIANSADICSFFFAPAADPDPSFSSAPTSPPPPNESLVPKRGRKKKRVLLGGANRHRCRLCQNVYTQAVSTGYTNLLTHLRLKHPDWSAMFTSQKLVPVSVAPGRVPRVRVNTLSLAPTDSSPSATSSSNPSTRPAGRKRGPVYDHFVDVSLSANPTLQVKKMRCLYCHCDTPQLSGRLKRHLAAKCPNVPQNVKAIFATAACDMSQLTPSTVVSDMTVKAMGTPIPVQPVPTAGKVVTVGSEAVPSSSTSLPTSTSKATNRDRLGATRWQAIEAKLTAALVTTKSPWKLLDNADFRTAVEMMLPVEAGEFPLTAGRARTEVLDQLSLGYDRECRDVLTASTAVTIGIRATGDGDDGGTADAGRRATYVALDEWRRAFVLSVGSEPSAVPDVAEILPVLSKVQLMGLNSKLFLCAPTWGTYAHARRDLLRDAASATDRAVVLMGVCMTQQTALLVRELVRSSEPLEEALDAAVLLADALHVVPSLHERVLRGVSTDTSDGDGNVQKAFVQVSCTSWRSIAIAVKQTSRLQAILRPAISEEKGATSSMLRRLLDVGSSDKAWIALRHTDQLLAPLHCVSVLSEIQTTTSGQILALWIWLFGAAMRSPLFDDQADALRKSYERRLACYVEEHSLACLVLDPRVRGVGLSVSGLRRCRGVAVRVAATLVSNFNESNFIRSYNDYMKQQGDFGESGVWNAANTSNPIEFWNDYEGDALHDQLAVVAKTVCSFVPHTCSLEELWTARSRRSESKTFEASKELEQCTKVRYGAARSTQASAKDVMRNCLMLLDVEDGIPFERMLQVNAVTREENKRENNQNVSVRAVLERIQDGIAKDAAGFSAPLTSLDVSWFDVSPIGLDKIRSTMETYLSAAAQ
uniref:BED-type domain-containing protein n=1 Tax=Peronospora matthiolae TaxID=2874970 RepID=A0AAV1UJK0_9STRA